MVTDNLFCLILADFTASLGALNISYLEKYSQRPREGFRVAVKKEKVFMMQSIKSSVPSIIKKIDIGLSIIRLIATKYWC